MSEREWTDACEWNLRHPKPGATIRQTSYGVIETDESGRVLRVTGRMQEGQRQSEPDPETGLRTMETLRVLGAMPTREDLLAGGYQDCAIFPLTEEDADLPISEVPVTEVASSDRTVLVEPEPGDPPAADPEAAGSGEMGLVPDLDAEEPSADDPITSGGPTPDDPEGYESPFEQGPGPATGAPTGAGLLDSLRDGSAKVLSNFLTPGAGEKDDDQE